MASIHSGFHLVTLKEIILKSLMYVVLFVFFSKFEMAYENRYRPKLKLKSS